MKFKKNAILKLHKKIKRFILRKKLLFMLILLLIFPLLVDLFYHIPFDFFYIRESDLLEFYGVSLGIYLSYITYSYEKEKAKKSRDNEIKPYLAVNLSANEDGYFELTLSKVENLIITDVFLFEEPLDNVLKSEQTYTVNFHPDNEVNQILDISRYDINLLDSDGYPKYILISCCDVDNRMWQGEYIKLSKGNEKIYVLKDMYLV